MIGLVHSADGNRRSSAEAEDHAGRSRSSDYRFMSALAGAGVA